MLYGRLYVFYFFYLSGKSFGALFKSGDVGMERAGYGRGLATQVISS
jgi:hypothetical protein